MLITERKATEFALLPREYELCSAAHLIRGVANVVVLWGTKLMGKCDVVPGLFHVATKFGHLWFLPLIPMGSWIVTEESGNSMRGSFGGVPVSLSLKSIVLAWARTILFVMGMGAALWTLIVVVEGKKNESWIYPALLTALLWGLWIILLYAPFVTRASFSRACRLAKQLGMTQQGFEMIGKIYGQSVAQAFEVKGCAGNSCGTTGCDTPGAGALAVDAAETCRRSESANRLCCQPRGRTGAEGAAESVRTNRLDLTGEKLGHRSSELRVNDLRRDLG